MLDKLFKISGTIALYGFASLFLASLLLAVYLGFAWNIDRTKRVKMLAVAQGLEIADIQKAVEDRIAEMTYEEILEERSRRLREREFRDGSSEQAVTETLLADEKKINAELKKIKTQREAFDQYIKDFREQAAATGLAEETRLIEEAEPEMGKDIILGIIRDYGDWKRVLTMLLAMDERRRGEILYVMRGEEEQKKLIELLQRIGNGEPLTQAIDQFPQQNQQPNSP